MKKVFTLACSVALICNFVQGQDATLAKIDEKESTTKRIPQRKVEVRCRTLKKLD